MKMMTVVNILFVVLLPISSSASEAKSVLREYLDLDARGARLQEWQSKKYLVNPGEEPGWDEVTLIRAYSIDSETCSGDQCIYKVTYSLYPTKEEPQVAVHRDGGKETISFKMQNRKGQWLIENFIQPHILADSYKENARGR